MVTHLGCDGRVGGWVAHPVRGLYTREEACAAVCTAGGGVAQLVRGLHVQQEDCRARSVCAKRGGELHTRWGVTHR